MFFELEAVACLVRLASFLSRNCHGVIHSLASIYMKMRTGWDLRPGRPTPAPI